MTADRQFLLNHKDRKEDLMRNLFLMSAALLTLAPNALGDARVIITEIMHNPASSETKGQAEWVEIANVGDQSIDIKDWRLGDEHKRKWGKFSCTLAPGGVAVIISDAIKEKQFRDAWDEPQPEGSAAPKL